MRWHRSLSAVGALALSGGAALAEPATPEGAKAIEQGYAAYFSQGVIDEGIVSVEPQGDGYLVTWNPQKAFEAADAPNGRRSRRQFQLRADARPGRRLEHEGLPFPADRGSTCRRTRDRRAGSLAFDGFHLDTALRPAGRRIPAFDAGDATIVTGAFQIADGAAGQRFQVQRGRGHRRDARQNLGRRGGDRRGDGASLQESTETIAAPQPNGGPLAQFTYTMGGGVSRAGADGAARQGNRRIVEIPRSPRRRSEPTGGFETAPAVDFTAMAGNSRRRQDRRLQFQMPFGTATMKSFGESDRSQRRSRPPDSPSSTSSSKTSTCRPRCCRVGFRRCRRLRST